MGFEVVAFALEVFVFTHVDPSDVAVQAVAVACGAMSGGNARLESVTGLALIGPEPNRAMEIAVRYRIMVLIRFS